MRLRVILVASSILMAATCNAAMAQSVSACWPSGPTTVGVGFLTGEDALRMSHSELSAYVIGFVNGALSALPFLGGPLGEKCARAVKDQCLVDRSNEQLAAMLTKWLRDRPDRWHESLNTLTLIALVGACARPELSE